MTNTALVKILLDKLRYKSFQDKFIPTLTNQQLQIITDIQGDFSKKKPVQKPKGFSYYCPLWFICICIFCLWLGFQMTAPLLMGLIALTEMEMETFDTIFNGSFVVTILTILAARSKK